MNVCKYCVSKMIDDPKIEHKCFEHRLKQNIDGLLGHGTPLLVVYACEEIRLLEAKVKELEGSK